MTRHLALAVLFCLSGGCSTSAPDGPSAPWERTEFLLKTALSSGAERPVGVAPSAWTDLQVLREVSTRIGSVRLFQLTQPQADQRLARIQTSFGGWSTSFEVRMQYRDEMWSLVALNDLNNIRNQLTLTSSSGLPFVHSAQGWRDGLSGFDSSGRPNRSVLIQISKDEVRIDDQPVQERSERHIRDAVRTAFIEREDLANQARATYGRHVSIAAARDVNAGAIIDAVRWAGAEGSALAQLLVQTDDGPGWLPIGHISKVPGSVPIRRQVSSSHSSLLLTDLETGASQNVSVATLEGLMVPTEQTERRNHLRSDAIRILIGRNQTYERLISILHATLKGDSKRIVVGEVLE